MKKSVKNLLLGLLSLALLTGSVLLVDWHISCYKTETYKIDLSQFSGRIIPADNIKPGTFTINVPMSEAVKYGEDAILSYGEDGVRIWKPDNRTTGVFLYSGVTGNNKLDIFDAIQNNREIILIKHSIIEKYILSALLALCAIALWLISLHNFLPWRTFFQKK